MSIEEMINRIKGIFPDTNRKRRRTSNCVDSGPPPKFVKNVREQHFIRDDSRRAVPLKKKFFGSMGSILSKLKSHSNACEPTEEDEYSDGEDVIIIQKYKKSDLAASRIQQIQDIDDYRQDKMDATNIKSTANRPPPGLIPKNKWSRVPDLQKMVPPSTQRVNGYQCENDTSTTRNCLVNGNSLSFKPQSGRQSDSTLSRNFSNYINSASNFGPKFTSFNPSKQLQTAAAADKQQYEKLLKSVLPDYVQSLADTPLPTDHLSIVSNHVAKTRPQLRKSVIDILDEDFIKKQENATRLFSESSIHSDRSKVTPVNTVQMKMESLPIVKDSYPDIVREKYSAAITQRHEKISQQEKKSNKISTMRIKHCNSYENLLPGWCTPDIVIFDEDIEEKIDDFPEFTDSQKQIIRHAMHGSPHAVLMSKFNIQITRDHIHTLQWAPLAWLNDEVINFYMNLLTERGELRAKDGYPKVYAFNTFFTQRLVASGHAGVKRWTKKIDLFSVDIIPVPVHVGNVHWCMAIISMREKTIKYYDSMGAKNNRVLSALLEYLREESLDKRKMELDLSGWKTENVTGNPHQQNGSDCGVFSCMTAEFICRNRPIVFTQQHMEYFRQKMVLEISTGKLLL